MRIVLDHTTAPRPQEYVTSFIKYFTHIIKVDGIKSGKAIPTTCSIRRLDVNLVTPRRIKANLGLKLETQDIELNDSCNSSDIHVYWKHKPQSVPAQHSLLEIEHIFKIDNEHPAARKLLKVAPTVSITKTQTLTNRIVIKGKVLLNLRYVYR